MVVQLRTLPIVWRTAGTMPKKNATFEYFRIYASDPGIVIVVHPSTQSEVAGVGSSRKSVTCHVFWIKGCGVFFTPICLDEFGVTWIKGFIIWKSMEKAFYNP